MLKSLKGLIWSLATLFCFISWAEDEWMKISNLEQFQKVITEGVEKNQIKKMCQLQIKNNKLPSFCYQWFKKLFAEDEKIKYLDERCKTATDDLQNIQLIETILDKVYLSSFCKQRLVFRKKELEYQLRDKQPSEIFRWFFQ